ncbi:MAG TPA: NAD(+) synthase [Clostridia bacterium]|nr:NAD(+) synthase [Clostridia bacterium]
MKDGFIKVAAGSVPVTVADTKANAQRIKGQIDRADEAGVNLLVLPELCITGYTCGDLFYSDTLLASALQALEDICQHTAEKYPLVVVGLPIKYRSKLYNCAAVVHRGKVLGLVPKTHLPNYAEFYEKRQFTSGDKLLNRNAHAKINGKAVPLNSRLLFCHDSVEDYRFGVEICEDLWAPNPPSHGLCRAGAVMIANPSASGEVVSKEEYRRLLVNSTSARLLCAYIYANAGPEESTQDIVFSRHHIISENGTLLAENKPFVEQDLLVTEVDCAHLANERHRMTGFACAPDESYTEINFKQAVGQTALTRKVEKNPFIPADEALLHERAEKILRIQAHGLKKRLDHIGCDTAVVGISGGLDSCLALLVMVRTMDMMHRSRKDIVAVTMPCFGTTERTRSNAEKLCEYFGVTLREIDITKAVQQHFKDIDHDDALYDVTFENAQARERTQVLMDIANQANGIVVGTGDLSELALGWATYNGDHMSMYGVNASVPKTLVQHIVRYAADKADKDLSALLMDILDTPISPELLPVDKNSVSRKTEDVVGPYELHDFFLYHMVRLGFSPSKIYRLACYAFKGAYSDELILKWLKVFVGRFFSQQFKRSCMPDGPKIGSVSLSPRSDWRMPSDASAKLWMDELEM